MRALTPMMIAALAAVGVLVSAPPTQMTSSTASPANLVPDDLGDPAAFLAQLRERERELNERELALHNREQSMETLLLEVEARIEEMEEIHARIDAQLSVIDAQRQTRIAALADMYEAMDPSSAAAQLSELDTGTIIDILMAMERDGAAIVLESIAPEKAAEIITQMSRRE